MLLTRSLEIGETLAEKRGRNSVVQPLCQRKIRQDRSHRSSAIIGLACIAIAEAAVTAHAEEPPRYSAAAIIGQATAGANYRLHDGVRSDGLLRIYTLDTDYGSFVIYGDAFLAKRLQELTALTALEKQSESEAFANAAAKAVGAPIKAVGGLIRNPIKGVRQTVSGIGEAFDRVASGVANPGSNPDGAAASILGVSTAKRQIAAQLGVDPYTDFEPLADGLDEMAKAAALGGLTVRLATSAIPGTAGLVVSTAATTQAVQSLVRDKTPAQLNDINKSRLKKAGVSSGLIAAFLGNRLYTPEDQTAIAGAIAGIKGVKGADLLVARAAQVERRDLAVFLRRRMEMLAAYHRSSGDVAAFIDARGIPLNRLRDGTIVFLAPIDSLSWTPTVANASALITESVTKSDAGRQLMVVISGEATDEAARRFQSLGWKIRTGAKF